MCRIKGVHFGGCGHIVYHVTAPGACYVPVGGFECSSPGVFMSLMSRRRLPEELEVVHLRCASCVFRTAFPARAAVVARLLPNHPFAASPAVQHVWYDREVRPYLRESDRAPRFDWQAASAVAYTQAFDWVWRNGYTD